jgi:hypothetical protein
MLDTITSTSVDLLPVFVTGSSSTDGEDKEFLNRIQYPAAALLRQAPHIILDTASYGKLIPFYIDTESFTEQVQVEDKASKLKSLFGSWIESGDEDKQLEEIYESRQITTGSLDE